MAHDKSFTQKIIFDYASGIPKMQLAKKHKTTWNTVDKILNDPENQAAIDSERERQRLIRQELRDAFIEKTEKEWMEISEVAMSLLKSELVAIRQNRRKDTEIIEVFDADGKLVERKIKTKPLRQFNRILAAFREVQKPFLAVDKNAHESTSLRADTLDEQEGSQDDLEEFEDGLD